METPEVRLRRLRMRSARRGTREMDLILDGFAEASLAALTPESLDAYEALLSENDQDLYHWMSGQSKPPVAHAGIVGRIRDFLARR
jgi:antitoxin CptB